MCSPPDHPPKNLRPLSQPGKSRGGEQSKCLCSLSANTIRTPSTNPKGCERRNPTIAYLLRREVQREREGEFPLPSSACSFPLSPAHFLGFLICSQSVLGSRWSAAEKLPKATQGRCLNQPDFTATPPPLSSALSDTASFGLLTSQTTKVDIPMVNVYPEQKLQNYTTTPPNSAACTALLTCTSDVCHSAHQDPRDPVLQSDWSRRRVEGAL